MRVLALISGGKDSCYNLVQCVCEGHEIVALANLYPQHSDELDSYMYQSVGHEAVDLYAEAMGLPLYRRAIGGASVSVGRDYERTEGDEVEDLWSLLEEVRGEVGYEGVAVGAILSDYQRVRVENVCSRLGVTVLSYLWRRDQTELLQEMIQCDINAIIIKVAALGLEADKHLGKSLKQMQPQLLTLKEKYGLNVCGEGGEYETVTLDCPLFKKRIVVEESTVVLHSDDLCAPVTYLKLNKLHLEDKEVRADMSTLRMMRSVDILQDLHTCGLEQRISADQTVNTPSSCDLSSDISELSMENVDLSMENSLSAKQSVNSSECSDWFMKRRCIREGFVWMTGIVGRCQSNVSDSNRESWVESGVRSALDTVKGRLIDEGMNMSDLIAVHLYVSDMKDFIHINKTYLTYFSINPPIRLCCEVSLPAGVVLLLDCVARCHPTPSSSCNPAPSSSCVSVKRTMHVQGISHWAPANIGPYSQAVVVDDVVYVAGQIGLVPGSMQMLDVHNTVSQSSLSCCSLLPLTPYTTAVLQSRLALRHSLRAIRAMQAGGRGLEAELQPVSLSIMYVTRPDWLGVGVDSLRYWSQKEDKMGSDELPLWLSVVVTGLPRGACVEWQVIGLCSSQSGERTRDQLSVRGERCEARVEYMCTERTQHDDDIDDDDDTKTEKKKSLQFILSVFSKQQLPADHSCENEMRAAVKCVSLLISRLSLSHQQLGTLRLFYMRKILHPTLILNVYKEAYGEVFGCKDDVTPVAMIPVEAFQDFSCLFSICHSN